MAPVEKCRHPLRQLPHHGRDIKGEQLAVAHQHPPVDGTWNLENLYRPGGPFGPKDKAAYETKLAALAAVITELDPALLGVQEVGEPEALDDLVGMLDGDWHVALSQHPDGRGIRVGFLSRTALEVLADTNAFPAKLRPVQEDDAGAQVSAAGRGFLAVEVATGRGPLRVAVAHLKSKLLSFPGRPFLPRDEGERARYGAYALYRRAAEATTLRRSPTTCSPATGAQRDVAVLGDLNDEVQAATTQILLGPPGSEIGTPGYEQPDRGDAEPAVGRGPADPRRAALLPRQLRAPRADRPRPGQPPPGPPGDGGGDGAAGATGPLRLPSVGPDPAERRGKPGSDHAPVWVRVGLFMTGQRPRSMVQAGRSRFGSGSVAKYALSRPRGRPRGSRAPGRWLTWPTGARPVAPGNSVRHAVRPATGRLRHSGPAAMQCCGAPATRPGATREAVALSARAPSPTQPESG